ncbi:hypothetical protein [Capnocytophaga leadbetteri]
MKFEKALDDICANCRYDVKFNRENNRSLPLFEEFKSYNSETWSKIANDKGFIKQFESYLQEVDEIKDLAYVINSNKANINEVKQAFKELFNRNSDEIFKTNPNIWKQFDRVDGTGKINSLKNFKDLVEDISFDTKHPIFNFIKAE